MSDVIFRRGNKPSDWDTTFVKDSDTLYYFIDTGEIYLGDKLMSGSGGIGDLPIASETVLGGIKVGANLHIDSQTGVLSADGQIPATGITKEQLASGVQASLDKADSALQDLVAGSNISISGTGTTKTISAMDTTYSAGTGISISNNNEISVNLQAGEGISISGNTISLALDNGDNAVYGL